MAIVPANGAIRCDTEPEEDKEWMRLGRSRVAGDEIRDVAYIA